MPYANNNGVRIHYKVEGEGPPVVLQHGFTGSLEDWFELGYVETLKDYYRLILMDARGHGASDKPHDHEAYDLKLMAEDVVAVLDHLNVSKAHFFGYSMGGRIGFAVAKYRLERFSSFIIGGSHPYQRPPGAFDSWIETLKKGPEAIASLFDAPPSPALQARLLTNDVEALIAYLIKSNDSAGYEEVLPTMTMPCLLFAGEADGNYPRVQQCVTHMANVTFASFPGLNHAGTFFHSDLVLPHVTEFLKGAVLQAGAAD